MDNRIMKRLPRYYRKSVIMWGIAKGIDSAFTECDKAAENFDNELYVSTAEKNLKRWENDLQLVTPPLGGDYEAWLNLRRGNILAKRCGDGICTESMIINTAQSYTDGLVSIDRSYYKDYVIMLDFLKTGIPLRLTEILDAVSEVKPAHMLLKYNIKYRTWRDVLDGTTSWADLRPYTWRDVIEKEDILNGKTN
ncbi:MAG: DUF2313 domain-containing protein [Clostridiales bacterium]|nr:DUF2313 domain-containing protein [Clostridiales bacterium]